MGASKETNNEVVNEIFTGSAVTGRLNHSYRTHGWTRQGTIIYSIHGHQSLTPLVVGNQEWPEDLYGGRAKSISRDHTTNTAAELHIRNLIRLDTCVVVGAVSIERC